MSSVQGGTHSFSAGTRQKFTPEYLAKQLPMFQERIPRASQVRWRESERVCVYSWFSYSRLGCCVLVFWIEIISSYLLI